MNKTVSKSARSNDDHLMIMSITTACDVSRPIVSTTGGKEKPKVDLVENVAV